MIFTRIFKKLQTKLNIFSVKRLWKKTNSHNHVQLGDGYYSGTYLSRLKDGSIIKIGNHTYGTVNAYSFGNPEEHLQIGNYCSIAPSARFLLSGEHACDTISTYPFRVHMMAKPYEALCKGPITVDDDVWIGDSCLILSGVHIGQGAVIAAGSVVTRDIPPYAIAGGVPAKTIRYRFSPELIEELLKVDYSQLDPDMVRQHEGALYQTLQSARQLSWLPKRTE